MYLYNYIRQAFINIFYYIDGGIYLKVNYKIAFQIATIFIGTIVGAGLSSGKELSQFFSQYGYWSFLGLILCAVFYIGMSKMIIAISCQYKLHSYDAFIGLISPGIMGKVTNIVITFFFFTSTAIVIAGSGALINQYFGIPVWAGILIMVSLGTLVLLRETNGLIEINSFIVPSLVIIMTLLFITFTWKFPETFSFSYLKLAMPPKRGWVLSTILYAGFNIMSCIGILVPLSTEIKNTNDIVAGVVIGSIFLTFISCIINFLMMVTFKNALRYEIPLLYVAKQIGPFLQFVLLCVIWLEMFSSKVSNIYSLAKSMQNYYHFSFRKSIFIIVALSLPITQIGFGTLITYLYPFFGALSIIFVWQCVSFYKTLGKGTVHKYR